MGKYKLNVSMTPKSIVDAIRFFEMKFGESYLEYHDIFQDCREVMEFAYKKGYLSEEKYVGWKEDWNGNVFHIDETFQVIFSDDEDYEPYCISYEDEESDEDYDTQYEKALLVYGELICSRRDHFNQFISEMSSGGGNLDYLEVIIV